MNKRGSEYSKRYREKKKKALFDSQKLIESLEEQIRQLSIENTSLRNKIQKLEKEKDSISLYDQSSKNVNISSFNQELNNTNLNTDSKTLLSSPDQEINISLSNQELDNSAYNTVNGSTSLSVPPNREINISSSNQELNNSAYNITNGNTSLSPDQNPFSYVSPQNQEINETNTSSNQVLPYTDFTINVNTPLLLDQSLNDSSFTTLYLNNLF
ncbi:4198_t:CDS:2 [Ambispora gerdemannii]|uniref:4198_t:CDS:1 n=1 Tax=Ambispora gerdemannii TaxID=144530 RepID=A0A9N9CIY6_9GLOM|nr:4198_t:CDS:2 [Ambispora gerdemannii]